jgi:formylglycine-generating enzyme required for sulfatase activity
MARLLGLARQIPACPPDSVRVGAACLDKYEASVWQVPPADVALIRKIRLGSVTLADLQAGATQRGASSDDYGAACIDSGVGCLDLYAVSIPGVAPSRRLTWFQAIAAARNAGKRLLTNAEWQAAALGTPDGAPCLVTIGPPGGPTGSAGCVSNTGLFDMVGNLSEWVADWTLLNPGLPCVTGYYASNDFNCLSGLIVANGPGAIVRGGNFQDALAAGAFAVGALPPTFESDSLGFRGAR